MADIKLDDLVAGFVETKDNNDFVAMMEVLEESTVLIPAMAPKNITPAMAAAVRAGKTVPVDPNNQPEVCLLSQNGGEKVFPVFTSKDQIPKEKMPPVIMNAPFKAVVAMVIRNRGKVSKIVVNPFTMGVVLNENLIELASKRAKAKNNPTVQVTEKDFHKIAHTRVAREVLPGIFLRDSKQAVSDLRIKREQLLIDAYKSIYPDGLECPYTEEDFALMMLQLEDNLLLIRIDMPDNNMIPGGPERIYMTVTDDDKIRYFVIEKSGKDTVGEIAEVVLPGQYLSVMEKPDNGAEIETIVSLVKPS